MARSACRRRCRGCDRGCDEHGRSDTQSYELANRGHAGIVDQNRMYIPAATLPFAGAFIVKRPGDNVNGSDKAR